MRDGRRTPGVAHLLSPVFQSARNGLRHGRPIDLIRGLRPALFALALWATLSHAAAMLLRSFQQHPEISGALVLKLLALAAMGGVVLTAATAAAAAMTVLYDERECTVLLGAPVNWLDLFLARYARVAARSAWAPGVILIPLLYAVSRSSYGGLGFVVGGVAGLVAIIGIGTAAGILLALALAAGAHYIRMRRLVVWLGVAAGAALILAGAGTIGRGYRMDTYLLEATRAGISWAPHELWARTILHPGSGDPLALAAFIAVAALVSTAAAAVYGQFYRKSVVGLNGVPRSRNTFSASPAANRLLEVMENALGTLRSQVLTRDVRTLARDPSEKAYIALALVSIVFYLWTIRSLQVADRDPTGGALSVIVGLANLGAAILMQSAFAARLVYPLFGNDAAGVWIWRASPASWRAALQARVALSLLLLLAPALIIPVAGGVLVGAHGAVIALTTAASLGYWSLVAAGANWAGIVSPAFQARSASEASASSSATILLLTGACFAVAVPVALGPYALMAAGHLDFLREMGFSGAYGATRTVARASVALVLPPVLAVGLYRRAARMLHRAGTLPAGVNRPLP
jgi:hypothetical protein